MERKIFVGGSTGAVGRTLIRLAGPDAPLVPHVRPRTTKPGIDPRAKVVELSDAAALEQAMKGCTTVIQLIGTMRARFGQGDTYESSDIGTTQQLADAAKKVGVDHFVLLSSVGAGRPLGAYLKAKARAEALVRGSGIPFTIFRPSAFVGEDHRPPAFLATATKLLGLRAYQPIAVETLARAILRVAIDRAAVGEVLEGESLWRAVSA